mmetsp:Transcript_91102/g.253664  ORF Transcript_91102/g.253664 Transcript_91102/m.253664 type:complete len:663 (+) Transcript_91102:71-2059(+)
MAASAVLVAGAIAFSQAYRALACTIVAVGRDASASGSPIVSHTDDSGTDTTDVRLVRVPRRAWPPGSVRPLYNWADGYPRVVNADRAAEYAPVGGQQETSALAYIPQVAKTFAYWDMDYGVQNERGLSIGESTCTARTVGWPATPDRPYGYNQAGIEDLSKIAMERCETARCAVETMGAVAVELGFYSADSGEPSNPDFSDSAEALAVADATPGELWIFNVMTGRSNASAIWAAMRVPPGHVVAVGNSFTIRKMNLSDPANFLYSPGVTKLAEEMGWWSPSEDEPGIFDFFGSYGFQPDTETGDAVAAKALANTLRYYSGRRMWRIFSLLSPLEGAKLDPEKGNLPKTKDPYPSSVPAPKGSITARQVMDVLRDHYEGTPYDLTQGMAAGPFGSPNRGAKTPQGVRGQWERAISMHRTSWSYVLEARPRGRSVTWLGYDSPHGTAYLPFFGSATGSAPESFHSHEGCMSKFSTKVAWWAYNLVNQYSDLNFALINKDVRAKAKTIEDEAVLALAAWEKEADQKADDSAALELLTARSNSFAEAKVGEWWDFAWSLFAKYGRYVITYDETAHGEAVQRYPDWWVLSPEVGFTLWAPQGPYHGIQMGSPSALAVVTPGTASVAAAPLLLAMAFAAATGAIGYRVGLRHSLHGHSCEQDVYIAQP